MGEFPPGQLVNRTTGRVLAARAHCAENLQERLRGLIGRASLPADQALGIARCDWVHTFGVRFPLDIAYCDDAGHVLLVVADLAPNRIAPRALGARVAWEMASGNLAPYVSAGHLLEVSTPPIVPGEYAS